MIELDRKEKDLKVLFTEEQIAEKTQQIADKINAKYPLDETLHVICVLKGSVVFTCDLVRKLKMPVQLEFVRISSYGDSETSTGKVRALDLTLPDLSNKNVVIVEDIIDTGLTAKHLIRLIKIEHKPKKMEFVALLNKTCARKTDITVENFGYEVDDKFLVGYGLDHKGFYRNLPYIGYFEK